MDPKTRLDYVLFQLTPTRTRCDLVIFSGGENEKLATGIFQPFITHLKSVSDQISKGGYSVTLRASSVAGTGVSWFTKVTLQRFVRFVNTPEVLERPVTLEKEIEQIEDSIQANSAAIAGEAEGNELGSTWTSHKSTALSKSKGESDGDNGEENSKVGLQRVLEIRKTALCKEQAMAYARAVVVGFELDSMDDLLSFADAFGASRLREACVNFVDLCKRKNEDRMWVDQITAMQAFPRPELSFMGDSGIILAGEENATNVKLGNSMDASSQSSSLETSQEGRAQMAMPWPNHYPQYMQNFQGHVVPPYMFPGMQGQSPYFPGNMQWPVTMGDVESNEKSSKKKKKKKSKKKKPKQDESAEPSDDSSAETVSEDGNEGKKSSRKVVIRNINYITSKKSGAKESDSESEEEEEDGFVDGDSIKQQVEEAIGSLERRKKTSSRRQRKHKSHSGDDDSTNKETKGNENWDAFQNLLLKDKDSDQEEESKRSPLNMESEVVRRREPPLDDSSLITNGKDDWGRESSIEKLDAGENARMIKRGNSYDQEMLNPSRSDESRSYSQGDMLFSDGKLRVKDEAEEDWFRRNQACQETDSSLVKTFVGDQFHLNKSSERDALTDDSFMIHSRVEGQVEESRLRTDIMDSDVYGITQQENSTPEITRHEPDDLFMVLGREQDVTPTMLSWTPEIDFETNTLAKETSKIDSETATKVSAAEKTPDGKEKKSRGISKVKDAKSRISSRPDPKAKRAPWGSRAAASKTKSEMEEERKKRMEELLIQRQKRIAEKSSGSSEPSSRKTPTATKTVKNSIKVEANSEAAQSKAKPVLRSSTIERLAVARTAPKEAQQKPVIKRTSKPLGNKTEKSQDKKSSKVGKSDAENVERPSLQIKETVEDPQLYLSKKQVDELPASSVDEFKDIKELHSSPSDETARENNEPNETIFDANVISNSNRRDDVDQAKTDDQETVQKTSDSEDKQMTNNHYQEDVEEIKVSPPKQASPKKSVKFSETNMEEINYLSPRVSEIDIVTPPASELDHSRKKWNTEETSPKATATVFRKLLMFGRKTRR